MPTVLPLAHDVHSYLHRYGQCGPELPVRCARCDYTQLMHEHGCYWRNAVCRRRVYRIS